MNGHTSKLHTTSCEAAVTTTTASKKAIHLKQCIIQNFLVIWVDAGIDQSKQDSQNTLTQLRSIVNDVTIFTQPDECVDFLTDVKDEKVFLIVAGAVGQQIVPLIHDIPQLDTIYVFCGNKSEHEQWTKEWIKVKGIYTEITPICEALQLTTKQYSHDSIVTTFLTMSEKAFCQNPNQLKLSFTYSQIFKEVLCKIKYNEKSIESFANYSHQFHKSNRRELNIINDFKHDYRLKSPAWQYARECFTYQMFNRAFRTLEVDTMTHMDLFDCDLHRHIGQLYQKQVVDYYEQPFIVYRGQNLSTTDFEKLLKTKDELISNDDQQLRTFTNRKQEQLSRPLLEQTFDIDAKALCHKSLAYIKSNQDDYEKIIWYYEKALEIQQKIPSRNQPDLAISCSNINLTYDSIEVYSKALSSHEESLKIRQKTLPSHYPNDALFYNNIGSIYNHMRQYLQALLVRKRTRESLEKPLLQIMLVWLLSATTSLLCTIISNSICMFFLYLERALNIFQCSLPTNHSHLEMCD